MMFINLKAGILSALVCVLVAGSCGSREPAPTASAPVLTSTEPADGVSGLEGSSLTVRFNFDTPVSCPDQGRSRINAGDATVSQVFAPGSYVSVALSGLKQGESYVLSIPEGCICSQADPSLPAKAISFRFSMKEKEPDPPVEPYGKLTGIAEKLALGWNLGNQLDAYYNGSWAGDKYNYPDENVWGNPNCTQATFDAIKKAGFSSVRVPVTWLNTIGPAPGYTIDKAWLDRVVEVVGMVHKAGLNCIVNTHHDENHGDDHWLDVLGASKDPELNARIKDKVRVFWTQVAERLKGEGDWLIFESFNEINDGGWGWSEDFRRAPNIQCGILNEWNQVFVDAVRATGGNNATRWLGVPGYCAGIDFLDYFRMPEDPAGRTMLAVHFYDPFDYASGVYSEWGHTADRSKKAEGSDEDNVRRKFKLLYDRYVSKGIPVYVGEYGCVNRSDPHARKFQYYYMEYVTRAARLYGLPCFLWDNGAYDTTGENFGYFNHGDGSFIGEAAGAVELMVKAMYTPDPSYTIESIYNTAP